MEVKARATSFFHSHLHLYNLGFLSWFRRFSNLPKLLFSLLGKERHRSLLLYPQYKYLGSIAFPTSPV